MEEWTAVLLTLTILMLAVLILILILVVIVFRKINRNKELINMVINQYALSFNKGPLPYSNTLDNGIAIPIEDQRPDEERRLVLPSMSTHNKDYKDCNGHKQASASSESDDSEANFNCNSHMNDGKNVQWSFSPTDLKKYGQANSKDYKDYNGYGSRFISDGDDSETNSNINNYTTSIPAVCHASTETSSCDSDDSNSPFTYQSSRSYHSNVSSRQTSPMKQLSDLLRQKDPRCRLEPCIEESDSNLDIYHNYRNDSRFQRTTDGGLTVAREELFKTKTKLTASRSSDLHKMTAFKIERETNSYRKTKKMQRSQSWDPKNIILQ